MEEDDSILNFVNNLDEKLAREFIEDEKTAKANLPKAIAAKKTKFLKAIGATDQLDGNTSGVNCDDENLHLTVFDKIRIMLANESILFDDSIVVNDFMTIKRPEFDLKTYVSCVKRLYHDEQVLSSDLCYLLCHARDFTRPRNKLFTFSEHGTKEINVMSDDTTLSMSQQCSFTAKLMTLMDELLVKYSEAKYQQLNLNVTYMLLFMTRKMFKGKTNYIDALKRSKSHEDYVELCPRALCDRLPDDAPLLNNDVLMLIENKLFTLILYAYMNSTGLTRRVLMITCISHMQYTGLGLPMMFDKIVQLYNVTEARLWDALCEHEHESMFTLADFHDAQREGEDQVPPKTYTLFPYCRVLDGRYHGDLSCKNNKLACYAMACLIHKKLGTDTLHMRKAHWVRENIGICHKGETIAAAVYKKIS